MDSNQEKTPSFPRENSDVDLRRQEILRKIRRLRSRTRMGIWATAVFTVISAGAMLESRLIPPLSTGIREVLGPSPPVTLISIALIVYSFSALTLILARMGRGSNSYRGWTHFAYLFAFYCFYYYAGKLQENFWAVFISGLTILCLESYRVWNYCVEEIKKAEENIARLDRQV